MFSGKPTLFALFFVSLLLVGCGSQPSGDSASTLAVPAKETDEFEPYKNERLRTTLNGIFDRGSDSNTTWSVSVRAYGPQGQKLSIYQSSEGQVVKPASTMKILTSWTALQDISAASQTGSYEYNYIREMMKYSDNVMADTVLGWCGGVKRAYSMLDAVGVSKSSGLAIVDGSGLSYSNRLAAQDLVQLLSKIRASNKMRVFRSFLPVGGVDGTLAGRLGRVNGTIAAKTGTLTTDPTTALAGYGDSRSGWQIVFALLGDSVPNVDLGRATIDDALEEIINTVNYFPSKETVAAAH